MDITFMYTYIGASASLIAVLAVWAWHNRQTAKDLREQLIRLEQLALSAGAGELVRVQHVNRFLRQALADQGYNIVDMGEGQYGSQRIS
jgi:hypothetical protein